MEQTSINGMESISNGHIILAVKTETGLKASFLVNEV